MNRLALLSLFLLFLGCRQDGAEAGMTPGLPDLNLLYRTWQITQVVTDGQPQDNPQQTVVTFPRDGDFRGDQPDDISWCCKPSRFELTDNTLRFIYQTSNSCAAVLCLTSQLRGDVVWQITTLTETSLVLTSGKNRLEFKFKP